MYKYSVDGIGAVGTGRARRAEEFVPSKIQPHNAAEIIFIGQELSARIKEPLWKVRAAGFTE